VSLQTEKCARLLLLLSLVLTALIAAGLPRLVFRPGLPPPSVGNGQVALSAGDQAAVGMSIGSFAAILLLLVLAVPLVALVISALRGVHWKRLLAGLWSLLWKLALVAGVLILVVSLLPQSRGSISEEPLPVPRPLATAPLGPVPAWVIWAAGIALGAVVVLVSAWMILARRRRALPLSWEMEVARARQALLDGGDLREVIIRCYTRMAEALQEERKIERQASMTTGEFEALLAEKGLPREPVRQLTRLFESARYSPREPASGEEQSAIACLGSILEHCRREAPVEGTT
jgi:hypothetical protein